MKKIIVIALLVVAIAGFGDSWLSVDFGFSAFYSPSQTGNNKFVGCFESGNPTYAAYNAVFSIEATAFNWLKVGGMWQTNFANDIDGAFLRFSPCNEEFTTYAGIEPFKGLTIIYSHKCVHTFFPFFPDNDYASDKVGIILKGTVVF